MDGLPHHSGLAPRDDNHLRASESPPSVLKHPSHPTPKTMLLSGHASFLLPPQPLASIRPRFRVILPQRHCSFLGMLHLFSPSSIPNLQSHPDPEILLLPGH
ncbi:unnamed protein product, partial [Gadus morhua 'NCC']